MKFSFCLDEVKKASQEGTVVIHPSSSTCFMVEELTGEKPCTNVWVCGVVSAQGTCLEMGTYFPVEERKWFKAKFN